MHKVIKILRGRRITWHDTTSPRAMRFKNVLVVRDEMCVCVRNVSAYPYIDAYRMLSLSIYVASLWGGRRERRSIKDYHDNPQ